MKDLRLYKDIATRTNGDIYIGVVGPVRTGKSTFIKNFMEKFVIPNIKDENRQERAIDELPQSAAGRTIMTTEPKFIPNESVEISLDNNVKMKTRLVDCVGYLVDSAVGHMEDGQPRLISKNFTQLVMQNYTMQRSVAWYAKRLGITQAHLSTIVKQSTGKTCIEIITSMVIMDAKAQLKSTNLTIHDIAYTLNFTNMSFFGKYFKRHVGMSPQEYRNS